MKFERKYLGYNLLKPETIMTVEWLLNGEERWKIIKEKGS
jgi:hypothetical protein